MDQEHYPGGGYEKRPRWQWIVGSVVLAVIVCGLVYYFAFARKGGGYTAPSNTPPGRTYTPPPGATPTPNPYP